MSTATCSCEVVSHPSGRVWVAMTPDRQCPDHRHGQPWRTDQGDPA